MKVITELITWAGALPAWQSDAVRRIWERDTLTDTDVDEIYAGLKAAHGVAGVQAPPLQPFSKDHVGSATVHQHITILRALHSLENVNAIPPGQKLTFSPKGITLIYGDNAAGKSGFSRVLKRACRARGADEPVYPNVFAAKPAGSPAVAKVDVEVDGQAETTEDWTDGEAPPGCLANIAVFDSKTARLYVDEANKVRYAPYGLDVFTRLATLCQKLKAQLLTEQQAVAITPPIIAELVGQGKPVPELTEKTTPAYIDEHTQFTDADMSTLEESRKKLADLIANDPLKKAKTWRQLKQRVEQLVRQLQQLADQSSPSSIAVLAGLCKEASTAKDAAELAAKKAFSAEPLPGTGGAAWRALFESAQRFSEQVAYPDTPFPVVGEGSYCVLCQQPLDEHGKNRLTRFWNFIQQDTAAQAKKTLQALTEKRDATLRSRLALDQVDTNLPDELDEHVPDISADITLALNDLAARFAWIEGAAKVGDWSEEPKLTALPTEKLKTFAVRCEANAQQCETSARPGERDALEKSITALTARQLAHSNRLLLHEHLKTLQLRSRLAACLRAVDTQTITKKRNALIEGALTAELRTALDEESKALGAGHIPLSMKQSGVTGDTFHQVELSGVTLGRVDPSQILSEGEQRVVAIASFLAELRTSGHRCGIVFDDPVSSLDQAYRERVAKRLVEESAQRQVIVFTHDVFFLLTMQREAEESETDCHIQAVRRTGKQAGVCTPDKPWITLSAKDRLRYMRNYQQEAAKLHRDGKTDEYERAIGAGYGLLREVWERAIEQILLNDVVRSFRPGVETKRLEAVAIQPEDYPAVKKGMAKCSRCMCGHDRSPGAQAPVPDPTEFATDIAEVDSFIQAVESRRKQSGKATPGVAERSAAQVATHAPMGEKGSRS